MNKSKFIQKINRIRFFFERKYVFRMRFLRIVQEENAIFWKKWFWNVVLAAPTWITLCFEMSCGTLWINPMRISFINSENHVFSPGMQLRMTFLTKRSQHWTDEQKSLLLCANWIGWHMTIEKWEKKWIETKIRCAHGSAHTNAQRQTNEQILWLLSLFDAAIQK